MEQELVTAIITTHNRLNLLKRAIDSVFAQTYNNIELIVVDDASTDGTSKYCTQQPLHYIFIPKEDSKGGNYARNQGIRAAKGKYIAFLDDDDYWLPTKIEKQVNLIESKDCELVHCGKRIEFIKPNGTVKYVDTLPNPLESGDIKRRILYSITTTTTNILCKREALFAVGLFDENLKYWQEYELTIRLAQRGPFYFVNEPLSVYRVNMSDENRLTNKYYEWKDAVKYVHKKHSDLYSKLNLCEIFRDKLRIYKDASNRCKNSKLLVRHAYFYTIWLIFSLPFRLIDKINKIKIANDLL